MASEIYNIYIYFFSEKLLLKEYLQHIFANRIWICIYWICCCQQARYSNRVVLHFVFIFSI